MQIGTPAGEAAVPKTLRDAAPTEAVRHLSELRRSAPAGSDARRDLPQHTNGSDPRERGYRIPSG